MPPIGAAGETAPSNAQTVLVELLANHWPEARARLLAAARRMVTGHVCWRPQPWPLRAVPEGVRHRDKHEADGLAEFSTKGLDVTVRAQENSGQWDLPDSDRVHRNTIERTDIQVRRLRAGCG